VPSDRSPEVSRSPYQNSWLSVVVKSHSFSKDSWLGANNSYGSAHGRSRIHPCQGKSKSHTTIEAVGRPVASEGDRLSTSPGRARKRNAVIGERTHSLSRPLLVPSQLNTAQTSSVCTEERIRMSMKKAVFVQALLPAGLKAFCRVTSSTLT